MGACSVNAEEEESTVIAIDADRNSQHAVKWAVEHFLNKNASCTLIHVRTQISNPRNYPHSSQDFEAFPKQGRPPTQEELHQFFLPFRGFCARKGIVAKELVLHDINVSDALSDYVIDNSINNIVVGASPWHVFIRKFRDVDVATSLVKSVPESCMVHIVSKAKVQSIRPAGPSQNPSIKRPKSLKDLTRNIRSEEDLSRKSLNYGSPQGSSNGETPPPKLSKCSSQNSSYRSSLSPDTSNSCKYRSKSSVSSPENVNIRKSKPKRKSKKAMNHEKFGQEQEEWNVENARLAEEARLALEEIERQKTKAAMEKAEMSKLLAEMKSRKEKQTEIRAIHEEEERNRASNASPHNRFLFRRYNIKEIEVATNYFDSDLKIGEGAYGPVFKGVLDNTDFAVKALRPDMTQGEKQFNQEVTVLSRIRHPNIVHLLGACPEFGCLVYEYMENGSLEDRLFQKDNTPPIPWKVRFKIASEIATGLLFLHQTKPEPVVHRDLKPANILLDRNYASKITDVGLARLVPPSVANKTTEYHKTAAAGTFCYIDPEYQQTGLLGVKSDIYSLGVMLLQIITGKNPLGVAHLVEQAINQGRFPEVLDPNVTDWPIEDTLSYAMLALKCCEMRKKDRPSLSSVILPELNRLRNLGEVATYHQSGK